MTGSAAFLTGICTLTGLGTAVVLETAAGPQDWTVLGLLAAIVLGIGGKLVISLDKQVQATNDNGKQLALLVQKLEESSKRETDQRQHELQTLRDLLTRLPADVAAHMRHTAP